MTGPGAEMPFLEHLEELRVRLVRVLLALVAGFGVGLYLVQRFEVVNLLKAPIAPYLKVTGGKLVAQSPTEPVMITLKLALVLGLILSSPVLIYQIWGFFSPALYAKEKKVVVPTLLFGLLLFCAGAVFAFVYLLPQSLPILLGFQTEGIEILITFDNYFSFVVQLVVAMGICFEIPLVMIMLGALGILSAGTLNRFRRYAIVLAAIAGAILSPGTDVLSMIMMMVPILILYEIGFVGVWLVTRRQRKQAMTAAVILVAALAGSAPRVEAQVPNRPIPRDSLRRAAGDTTRPDSLRRPSQAVDTGAARRLGLPTAPRYEFAPDDSVITELLARPGYQSTRFRSDSATIFAQDRHLILVNKAMTRRGLTTLEGDSIAYTEADCLIRSRGSPALFDKETVLAGFGGIRYNTCLRRGIVTDALTSFKQEGTDWFLKGNLAQDSSSSRLFASKGEITSCDLPTPHYHFSAREVKWISRTVMVARPAVLYIRDVPILWLPFVFQDARPGRRSGILIPRFGLNDIVRQNPGYNRQITNIGYYWAPNDYFDMVAKLDWYANRYVSYGASGQYRLLSRDLTGGLGYSRLVENTGRRATSLRWDHRQNFDLSTSLNLSINYNSSSSTTQRNSLDPALSTQQITSSANFTKRYPWGTVALGGNRRQSITDNSVSTQFPSLSITPKPLDLGRNITWSPGFSLSNNFETNFPGSPAFRVGPGGVLDTLAQTVDRRNTTINFDTPLRIGGFTWRNGFVYNDRKVDGRQVIASRKIPDESTADPTDSITVSQVTTGDFSSDLDWQTGINLPPLFSSTWKLQPSVNIVNSTSGSFFLRNRSTNGDWVRQGKRLNFAISATPTFFGFFPGFGPIARIRHAITPTVSYSYSPSASIPADYARALAGPNGTPVFRSIQSQLISVGLTQNFEAKAKPRPGDTTSVENARKFRLLGITTTSIQYDFERAKERGKTGWLTDNLGNTFQSDLLPNFSLSLTHDLFRGPVGTDSAKFSPFLQSVSARVSVSGRTFSSLLGIFGIGHGPDTSSAGRQERVQGYDASQDRFGRRRNNFYGYGGDEQIASGASRSFSASFDYSVQRTRREAGQSAVAPRKNLGFSTNFSPTAFWSVRYSTQYNVTRREFESHTLDLERVLHEWRARFSFTRAPNGNFQFVFSVYLSDLQDIKFDYNQSSIER